MPAYGRDEWLSQVTEGHELVAVAGRRHGKTTTSAPPPSPSPLVVVCGTPAAPGRARTFRSKMDRAFTVRGRAAPAAGRAAKPAPARAGPARRVTRAAIPSGEGG